MSTGKYISYSISTFHEFPQLSKDMILAGYSSLIIEYKLVVPDPDYLCAISPKHKSYKKGRWNILTTRHKPVSSLSGHLTFALKNEGIDLAVLKALFETIDPNEVIEIIKSEPTGSYSRRIWFLYEWLTDTVLDIEAAKSGNFIPVVNEKLQFAGPSIISPRHRVKNNLPGVRSFCPMVRRTEKLDKLIAQNLSNKAANCIGNTHGDLISRAAAFLLLKDSQASYTIEGEKPPQRRIERWGKIIGQAGKREVSIEELERLQAIVIADDRFTTRGLRTEGGFVGGRDRVTMTPLPEHISAKHNDLQELLKGLISTNDLIDSENYNPVVKAAVIAFGFVFIHPFEDGNGRLHRYLFHHVLAKTEFVPKGLVFPVSAVILARIEEYQKVLQHYSKARLNLINWRATGKGNVEVLNETMSLYSYFDATKQAEFLFDCVEETVTKTLPEEVDYLTKYDLLNDFIKNYIDMPDNMVDLLIRFLSQNDGELSKRALSKEFESLTTDEVDNLEKKYKAIFL